MRVYRVEWVRDGKRGETWYADSETTLLGHPTLRVYGGTKEAVEWQIARLSDVCWLECSPVAWRKRLLADFRRRADEIIAEVSRAERSRVVVHQDFYSPQVLHDDIERQQQDE